MKTEKILNTIRHDIRCPMCNKLLLKAKFWGDYSIQAYCPRCKNIVEINHYKRDIEKDNNKCYNTNINKEEV